jgi:hypothetical protein
MTADQDLSDSAETRRSAQTCGEHIPGFRLRDRRARAKTAQRLPLGASSAELGGQKWPPFFS